MAPKKSKSTQRTIEIIYTFFIGILAAVFIGVGIDAFYPAPEYPEPPATLKVGYIERETTATGELVEQPEVDKAALVKQQEEYDKEVEKYRGIESAYNRNVSIIALVSAVVLLTISLTLLQHLMLISDGILLGGVFTLLYSVVRVFGSDDNQIRFVVVAVGLAVSLVLGYVKFIGVPSSKK